MLQISKIFKLSKSQARVLNNSEKYFTLNQSTPQPKSQITEEMKSYQLEPTLLEFFPIPPKSLEEYKKTMNYRAKHRGWTELDLIIGNQWKDNEDTFMSIDEVSRFEQEILQMENPNLFDFLVKWYEIPPELKANKQLQKVQDYAKKGINISDSDRLFE